MSEGKCALIGAVCPKTADPKEKRYCPFWDDDPMIWENSRTGEQKVFHCSAMMMMRTQKEVIAASNRPAAAVESVRNEIAQGMGQMAGVLHQVAAGRGLEAAERAQGLTHETSEEDG